MLPYFSLGGVLGDIFVEHGAWSLEPFLHLLQVSQVSLRALKPYNTKCYHPNPLQIGSHEWQNVKKEGVYVK